MKLILCAAFATVLYGLSLIKYIFLGNKERLLKADGIKWNITEFRHVASASKKLQMRSQQHELIYECSQKKIEE